MCEIVKISKEVDCKMKEVFPDDMPEEYFTSFKSMVKNEAERNKSTRRVDQIELNGKERDVIFAKVDDVINILSTFTGTFGC